MRILLCHNYYQRPGGEDQVFHDEQRLLESNGNQVVVYTRRNDTIRDAHRWKVALTALWSQETFFEVRRVIRSHRPDIMHCTNTFPLISPSVYYAARAENVPVVQSLHNYRLHCVNGYFLRDGGPCESCHGKWFASAGVLRACYRDSRAASTAVAGVQSLHRLLGTWRKAIDLYITCSRFARDKFVAAGMPAERVVVKPNFVDPDTGPGQGSGGYCVFVGRLSPEKGIGTLLDAWQRLEMPVPLKIIGDGPLAGRVKAAAQQDRRIQFLGWLPLEQVLEVVGEAAFLLMTSVWYEIFGRTIVEAFSKGTPVIASRLGAMAELVDDGLTGLCFQPGDPADLAAKASQLWCDAGVRSRMRQACRAEFEARYTAAANYSQLMAAYALAETDRHRMRKFDEAQV